MVGIAQWTIDAHDVPLLAEFWRGGRWATAHHDLFCVLDGERRALGD